MSRFDKSRDAKLKKLAECRPFVAASLCEVKRKCGRENCKCMRGEPHTAHVLTCKVAGKTKTVHVPKALVKEVKAWVEEHKRIKRLTREISSLSFKIIRNHVPASRAADEAKRKYRI